jgi:hypothetical protein
MGRDDQQHSNPQPTRHDARHGLRARWALAAGGLGLAGLLIACWTRLPDDGPPAANPAPAPKQPPLFQDWPKPDYVLLLSGQSHGYLQPCGCSSPQYGGYERRYNFVQTLKERGWPVVAADLGDALAHDGPQKLLKYQVAMAAMKTLGYTAVGVGLRELEAPLFDVIGQWALNDPVPALVAANLDSQNAAGCVFPWAVSNAKGAGPKVAFIGAVGPTAAGQVKNPDIKLGQNGQVLANVLKNKDLLAAKPELFVLLYQGTLDEAKACAQAFPQFRVIVCTSDDEEPPSVPVQVGETQIVRLGHKSRFVGVVGVYRTGKADRPFDLRYQLVSLGPEYETPANRVKGQPVVQLMEDYAQEVKNGNYLGKYGQRPHPLQITYPKAEYVGSFACKECHEDAYKIWKKSPHSGAYKTLEEARKPSLRQYDGECVVCHTVGFGYNTGFTNETKTAHLKNVGCESCHGPGSLHIADVKDNGGKPTNLALLEAMNPYKGQATKVTVGIFSSCQKCHDIDNDVNFKTARFPEYWKKIAHSK